MDTPNKDSEAEFKKFQSQAMKRAWVSLRSIRVGRWEFADINCDAEKIQNIILNLLNSARKTDFSHKN